jgi:hypothetical protein
MPIAVTTNTTNQQIVQIIQKGSIHTISVKTADYTLTDTDFTILADASNNAVTITLPLIPTQGQVYNIKCINSTFVCTIARNGNTIDELDSDLNVVATNSVTIQYDATYKWARI